MNQQKTAAIIIIGDEILSGRTADKNIHMMAQGLFKKGIVLEEVRVVSDKQERIINAVNALRMTYDFVFTSGGIGPTHDDITAESVAAAFNKKYDLHAGAYNVMRSYYGSESEINEGRRRMAFMPEGAKLIPNAVSGAPGFYIDNVYVMAGVPIICQSMFDWVLDQLDDGPVIHQAIIRTDAVESQMSMALATIQARYGSVTIGSYPHLKNRQTYVSLVLKSTDRKVLEQASVEVEGMIQGLGQLIMSKEMLPN